MNLSKLIKPRSLVVVGASDRPGSIGCKVALSTVKSDIADKVYYVNPRKEKLHGRVCYPCVAALPEVVDCAILCTPKTIIPELITEVGKAGIDAAIVYAGGFSEDGTEEGKQLEDELIAAARRYDMAVLGPNCNGITNNVDKTYMAMLGYTIERNRPTGIGVVSQSGYMTSCTVLPDFMSISYGVSVGNSNVIPTEDIIEFMIEDSRVNVVALYLEGVRDGEKFIKLLKRAQEVDKPVVILKTGRSAIGAKAAVSHTGSMAGSFARYAALFRKYNAVLTSSMQEFIYTALAFNILKSKGIMPKGNRLAAITLSGAENVVCADLCDAYQLNLVNLSADTAVKLAPILPEFAVVNNPIDATTYFLEKVDEFKELVRVIGGDESVDMLAINVEVDYEPDKKNRDEMTSIVRVVEEGLDKPIFAMSTYEATRNVGCRRYLESVGIPILAPGITGYQILANISDYVAYKPEEYDLSGAGVARALVGSPVAYTEYESKAYLASYGVNTGWSEVARSSERVSALAKGAPFPLAMKINSRDILHKTDAGGVVLGVADIQEAQEAYERIITSCRAYDPDAQLDGVLMTGMLSVGSEFIIGAVNDGALGPFVTVGLGGIFTEVFSDMALTAAPVSLAEATRMVESLKAAKLVDGYRGSPALDKQALCELIVSVSQFAKENGGSLVELDLNPVFVYEQDRGVAVADALLVMGE
jgi:acyl-CoA synthetase (NDP forming)